MLRQDAACVLDRQLPAGKLDEPTTCSTVPVVNRSASRDRVVRHQFSGSEECSKYHNLGLVRSLDGILNLCFGRLYTIFSGPEKGPGCGIFEGARGALIEAPETASVPFL